MDNKKFEAPTLELIDFVSNDIITLSGRGTLNGFDDPDADPWGIGD